jgi:hypothetical protein
MKVEYSERCTQCSLIPWKGEVHGHVPMVYLMRRSLAGVDMSWFIVKHAPAKFCQPFITSRYFLRTPKYCNLPDNPEVPALKGSRESEPLYQPLLS